MMRGPRSRHRPRCTLGEPSRARRAGRGRGPLGRGGGVDRGGGAPHPLSRFPPLRRPITRQAPAPGAASCGPATPKRQVFAGKKATGDLGSIPGLGTCPGEGNNNSLQYPCLRNPMDRGAWTATVQRVTNSWTRLSTAHAHTHCLASIH